MIHTFNLNHFIVTSQGLSATRWLCFVLALRGDVFVAHGHHSLDSVVAQAQDFQREKSLSDSNSLTLGTQLKDFYRSHSLDEIFEMYHAIMPNAKAYGCIHSYTLETLVNTAVNSKQGINEINIINLLRHPINYIDSHCFLIRNARERKAPIYLNYYEKVMFKQALERYPELILLDNLGTEEFIEIVVSCLSVCNQINDFAYSQFKHVQMEKITTDVVALKELSEFITGLEYSIADLEYFIHEGAINSHRNKHQKSREEIYASWETWKQDIAHMMIPSEILDKFEENNYDVSLLRIKSNIKVQDIKNQEKSTKADEEKCYSQQPQAELWRSQFYLQQAQAELKETKLQLQQTQLELEGLRSRLQQTQTELEQSHTSYPNPTLIEDNFSTYNIVAWKRIYYGLPQALGPVDISVDDLSKHEGIFVDFSIERLKNIIQNHQILLSKLEHSQSQLQQTQTELKPSCVEYPDPTLVENFGQYNIVAWRGIYYGLPLAIGPIDISNDNLLQIEVIFVELSVERVKNCIQSHLLLLSELEKLEFQLQETQSELQQEKYSIHDMQTRIQAMESSKFWRLRQKWFRLKKTLSLRKKLV